MTVTTHKLHLADRAVMLAMRGLLASSDKPASSPEARPGFDELISKVAAADGVTYKAAEIGGFAGWWCRPADAIPDVAILYLHGGAYVLGSAYAYRNFVGQIAACAGVAAFAADYGLAPEWPFPAAFDDALAAYEGLENSGYDAIAIAGDSAGGGLALALLSRLAGRSHSKQRKSPAGAIVMSPWVDLTLSGETMTTRAGSDPLLTKEALAEAAALYLGAADPRDPRASALYGQLLDLPQVTIHVGDDEIFLDDALCEEDRGRQRQRRCARMKGHGSRVSYQLAVEGRAPGRAEGDECVVPANGTLKVPITEVGQDRESHLAE